MPASKSIPGAKADLEDLTQYTLRNPFSAEKMTLESPDDIVIYTGTVMRWVLQPVALLLGQVVTAHVLLTRAAPSTGGRVKSKFLSV
jgi:hypothetical protein